MAGGRWLCLPTYNLEQANPRWWYIRRHMWRETFGDPGRHSGVWMEQPSVRQTYNFPSRRAKLPRAGWTSHLPSSFSPQRGWMTIQAGHYTDRHFSTTAQTHPRAFTTFPTLLTSPCAGTVGCLLLWLVTVVTLGQHLAFTPTPPLYPGRQTIHRWWCCW